MVWNAVFFIIIAIPVSVCKSENLICIHARGLTDTHNTGARACKFACRPCRLWFRTVPLERNPLLGDGDSWAINILLDFVCAQHVYELHTLHN